jgi:hypothetical protein
MAEVTSCPQCGGKLHVREGRTWRRCECIRTALNQSYIQPEIRDTDVDVAPGELLPLVSSAHKGLLDGWHQFRRAVWRTLLEHEPLGLNYGVLATNRLMDIQMERESGYSEGYDGLIDVRARDLLVLIVRPQPPHRWIGPLFLDLLEDRRRTQKITWTFILNLTPNHFYQLFEPAGDVFTDLAKRWYNSQSIREWK